MKKLLIILSFITMFSSKSYSCNKVSSYSGFSIKGVELQNCFYIPHMGKGVIYKFTSVCKDGGLSRNAYYKMKDTETGKWRDEVSKSVGHLMKFKIKKIECEKET